MTLQHHADAEITVDIPQNYLGARIKYGIGFSHRKSKSVELDRLRLTEIQVQSN